MIYIVANVTTAEENAMQNLYSHIPLTINALLFIGNAHLKLSAVQSHLVGDRIKKNAIPYKYIRKH